VFLLIFAARACSRAIIFSDAYRIPKALHTILQA
jgi:hypothetical protein